MRRKFAVTVLSIAHLLRAIDALLPQRLELQTAPSRTLPNALSMITPAPVVRKQNLLERATPETCGYVSGNPASPLTCPQSYSCTSTMLFAAAWACCNQIQCLGAYRTCANYGDDICMGLEDAVCSGIYTSYLSCSSGAPSCMTFARSESVGDESIRYSLTCGKSKGKILALVSTTTKGEGNNAPANNAAFTGFSLPSSTSSPSTGVDSSSGTSSTGTSSTNQSDNGSSWSSGAIAGIVVGILAIIVTVVVTWLRPKQALWLVTCGLYGHRHRRQQQARNIQQSYNMYGYSSQPQMAPPNGYPPPAYNYNGYNTYQQNGYRPGGFYR